MQEQVTIEINEKAHLGQICNSLAKERGLENKAIDLSVIRGDKQVVPFQLDKQGLPNLDTRTKIREAIERGINATGSDYVNPANSYCNVALDDSVEILSAGAESMGDLYREVLILGIDPIQVLIRKDVLLAAPFIQEIPNNYIFVRYNPGAPVNPDNRMGIVEPLRELWQSMELKGEFRLIGSDCKGFKLLVPYSKWNQISKIEQGTTEPLKNCLLAYMSFAPNPHK